MLLGSLQPSAQDSTTVSSVKAETENVDFAGMSKETKIETSLMLLCGISSHAKKRKDVEAILALLFTQFEVIAQNSSPLVTLRLMRVISCYSMSMFFPFIQSQLARGRVFIL